MQQHITNIDPLRLLASVIYMRSRILLRIWVCVVLVTGMRYSLKLLSSSHSVADLCTMHLNANGMHACMRMCVCVCERGA